MTNFLSYARGPHDWAESQFVKATDWRQVDFCPFRGPDAPCALRQCYHSGLRIFRVIAAFEISFNGQSFAVLSFSVLISTCHSSDSGSNFYLKFAASAKSRTREIILVRRRGRPERLITAPVVEGPLLLRRTHVHSLSAPSLDSIVVKNHKRAQSFLSITSEMLAGPVRRPSP